MSTRMSPSNQARFEVLVLNRDVDQMFEQLAFPPSVASPAAKISALTDLTGLYDLPNEYDTE